MTARQIAIGDNTSSTGYESEFEPRAVSAEPVAFGLRGWLHPARGRRGVVIFNTLAYQALCCQPALRALAECIAAAGLPCLRFDYPSEGDSLGQPHEPRRVADWLDGATAAVDYLQSQEGIEEIALVGLGFGALAALEAAARRRDRITRMVLLAPPSSGRALVREMRLEAAILSAEYEYPFEMDDGGLSIAGFEYTRETLDHLSRLKPNAEAAPQEVLVLAPNEAAQAPVAHAQTRKFVGYAAMLGARRLPHVPGDDWREVAQWLARDAPVAAKSRLAWSARTAELAGDGFTETALRFGAGEEVTGVICVPTEGAGDACAILLNTGANVHIGWARGAVTLSRRLAREAGIATLRMDLRGLGESAALEGGALAALYDVERTRDVVEAIATMKGFGYRRITLVGQCSGAFVALHSALRSDDVTGLVIVNLVRFALHKNETVLTLLAGSGRSTDGYIAMLRSGVALRRLVRGEAPLKGLWRAACKFGRLGLSALREAVASQFRIPPRSGSPEAWLHRLAARGVAMHFLLSETDASRDEFARYFGRSDWRARRIVGLLVTLLKGADHNLTTSAAQAVMFDHVRSATETTEK